MKANYFAIKLLCVLNIPQLDNTNKTAVAAVVLALLCTGMKANAE